MKRLRVIGLAAVATCLVSAVAGVTTAAAVTGEFKAESYPAIVEGKASPMTIGTDTGIISCTSVATSGTLASASATLSAAPTIAGCAFFGVNDKVTNNGCNLALGASVGTLDITCPLGSPGIEMKPVGWACTTTFLPQAGVPGLTFKNEGSGLTRQVVTTLNISLLKYTEVGAECSSPGSHANGRWKGVLTLKAYKSSGGVKGAQQGLFIE